MDVEIFFISRHQASDDHILPADKRKSIRLLLEKLKKMYPPIIGEKKEKYRKMFLEVVVQAVF